MMCKINNRDTLRQSNQSQNTKWGALRGSSGVVRPPGGAAAAFCWSGVQLQMWTRLLQSSCLLWVTRLFGSFPFNVCFCSSRETGRFRDEAGNIGSPIRSVVLFLNVHLKLVSQVCAARIQTLYLVYWFISIGSLFIIQEALFGL